LVFAALRLIDVKRDETLPAGLPPHELDSGGGCRPWRPLSMLSGNRARGHQAEKKYQESLKNPKIGKPRAQRSNLQLINQTLKDCFVAALVCPLGIAMTDFSEIPILARREYSA
jgi:hypothetical protein